MSVPVMPVRLDALLRNIVPTKDAGDVCVSELALHSSDVTEGSLFLALKGANHDARRYIADAEARGARAICFEANDAGDVRTEVPAFAVPHLARHASQIAARFFGDPSASIDVVAVTGTNGKSTCAWLVANALSTMGRKCGFLGTLGQGFPPELESNRLTTADSVALQRQLRALSSDGAMAVAMELSSHALDQHRADAVKVGVAAFTNLSRDHLDYHGDMENYGAAKARLFRFAGVRSAIINIADPFGRKLATEMPSSVVTTSYGSADADVYAAEVRIEDNGLSVRVRAGTHDVEIKTELYGRVNVANVLAVFAILRALGCTKSEIVTALKTSPAAPGRMERIRLGCAGPSVVVDYSHTPDSLKQALESLRDHTDGRLWCVFGCGGDRDAGKRPLMGAVAERFADRIIVTDDNPRGEPSAAISGDIVAGMKTMPTVIHNRRAAITHAIENAHERDIVLVAGKGDERTQEISGELLSMSDRAIVADVLGESA